MYLQSHAILAGLEKLAEMGVDKVARTSADCGLHDYEILTNQIRHFSQRIRFALAAYRPGWHFLAIDGVFVGHIVELLRVFRHHVLRPQMYRNVHVDLFFAFQATSNVAGRWNNIPIKESLLEKRKVCECQIATATATATETWKEIGFIDNSAI